MPCWSPTPTLPLKSPASWRDCAGRIGRSLQQHVTCHRPWGHYSTVDIGERFQVKRITVKPGAKLSLQKHYHRAEHWVVVRGTAIVQRDEERMLVRENESVYIPIGVNHRLENPASCRCSSSRCNPEHISARTI